MDMLSAKPGYLVFETTDREEGEFLRIIYLVEITAKCPSET